MEAEILLLDEELSQSLLEKECEAIEPTVKDFVETYIANQDKPVEEWLSQKMQEQLPEKSSMEIQQMTEEIIITLKTNEIQKNSLENAVANGRSKEEWFASEVKKATSAMSMLETVTYLNNLDGALQNANESLYRTITTRMGLINQNPSLDGFIAEQYHAQTFNLNAEATGSQYRAKVLEPNGQRYSKNSVDIVIVDGNGKVVQRYQSKYCKDAKATLDAFNKGDYNGQRKLVPEEQLSDIQKTVKASDILKAPDGTTSTSLSKENAKILRDEAQSGKWNELNWNEYQTKDLAIGIGAQAGYAALQGAVIGAGFDIAQKAWNGEDIKGEEVVEKAIVTGADFGVKAATAGALKVGVEKGIITIIPKGTPASTLANIAYVAIENVKIIKKIATGELTAKEGVNKLEQVTVATVAGLVAMGEGTKLGAAIGSIFGPVGTVVGGFIGGTVGYMAGSKVGETVVKGVQKVRKETQKVAQTLIEKAKDKFYSGINKVRDFCGGVRAVFGF